MSDRAARLFVAVDLPAGARAELAHWARAAQPARAPLRLLDPELLHVTLCFLGSQPAQEIPVIGAAVVACAMPVGALELGAPLWLPPRRPRALAIEIHDPSGALAALHAAVSAALAAEVGWEPERRRFRPHVTVARMREGAGPHDRLLPPTPELRFAVESLTVYRSFLARAGARYEVVERVAL